ncbi:hypothetical protein D3C71_1298690 [compost metagenome]
MLLITDLTPGSNEITKDAVYVWLGLMVYKIVKLIAIQILSLTTFLLHIDTMHLKIFFETQVVH